MSDYILSQLREMTRTLRQNDPLLQRGILTDWVCVVNPALISTLEEQFKQLYTNSMLGALATQADRLRMLTGRTVWIVNVAPLNDIEYMPEALMRVKYADWFEAMEKVVRACASCPNCGEYPDYETNEGLLEQKEFRWAEEESGICKEWIERRRCQKCGHVWECENGNC